MSTGSAHPGDDDLVLFFYKELDGRQAASVTAHLETCTACRGAMRTLESALGAVGGHEIPEPGPGYEAGERAAPRWSAWLVPRRLALVGAGALLVVAAFAAGRHWSAPGPVPPSRASATSPAPQPATTPAQVRERVLLVALGDHLERSQVVLVELMNSPTQATVDISGARDWARELVPANRLIRQTADQSGENVMAGVLDDLERLLVEIANGPSQIAGTELQQIRQRIEAQGIVFKIRVLDSDLRQREQAISEAVGRRSS
jgi:hypothetical protein